MMQSTLTILTIIREDSQQEHDWADECAEDLIEEFCRTIWATHGIPSEAKLAVIKNRVAHEIRRERIRTINAIEVRGQ